MMSKFGLSTNGAALLTAAPLFVAALLWPVGLQLAIPSAGVAAAVILASALSSVAGFAFSAICGAMLFHLIDDPVKAVQIMLICSMANQASMVFALRHEIDWRGLPTYLIGGLLGLPIGVFALLHAPHHAFTAGIGAFLLTYGLYMLFSRATVVQWTHPAIDVVAGFFGGITGGAAATPGAPVTIWCGLRGWDKRRQRALFQPYILVMQVAALLAIGVAAPRANGGPSLTSANLVYAAAGLLGTQLGMGLFSRMSNRQFRVAVNVLLIFSGISFVL